MTQTESGASAERVDRARQNLREFLNTYPMTDFAFIAKGGDAEIAREYLNTAYELEQLWLNLAMEVGNAKVAEVLAGTDPHRSRLHRHSAQGVHSHLDSVYFQVDVP